MYNFAGNDYNHRPRGYIPTELYKLIIKYKSIENILDNGLMESWSCNYENKTNYMSYRYRCEDSTTILNRYDKKAKLNFIEAIFKRKFNRER